ncbi:hypothetical protein GLOIN_2v1637481, partial [Rhizophagus irregularis DAOM 181602=DAOM 197198]
GFFTLLLLANLIITNTIFANRQLLYLKHSVGNISRNIFYLFDIVTLYNIYLYQII